MDSFTLDEKSESSRYLPAGCANLQVNPVISKIFRQTYSLRKSNIFRLNFTESKDWNFKDTLTTQLFYNKRVYDYLYLLLPDQVRTFSYNRWHRKILEMPCRTVGIPWRVVSSIKGKILHEIVNCLSRSVISSIPENR